MTEPAWLAALSAGPRGEVVDLYRDARLWRATEDELRAFRDLVPAGNGPHVLVVEPEIDAAWPADRDGARATLPRADTVMVLIDRDLAGRLAALVASHIDEVAAASCTETDATAGGRSA